MPKANPSTASTGEAPATYETAMAELEHIVDALESGSMPLEQMLASYQRGAELLAFCRNRLQAVEEQVRLIDGTAFKSKRTAPV